MQTYALVATVLLVAGQAQAKFDEEQSRKDFEACQMETGATETYEAVVLKEDIPTSDNGICLVECLMRKKKIYNEQGEYDPEAALAYLKSVMEGRPNADENVEKVKQFIEDCRKSDMEGLDKCEKASKITSCIAVKAYKAKIHIKPKAGESS